MSCSLVNILVLSSPSKPESAQFDLSWKVPAILYYSKRNYHTKYDLRSKFQTFNLEIVTWRWSASNYLLSFCCLPQLKIPSMPVCCWRRLRWLGSRGRVTLPSSLSWSVRCRRPVTWWGWTLSLWRSTRWVRSIKPLFADLTLSHSMSTCTKDDTMSLLTLFYQCFYRKVMLLWQ